MQTFKKGDKVKQFGNPARLVFERMEADGIKCTCYNATTDVYDKFDVNDLIGDDRRGEDTGGWVSGGYDDDK